MKKINLEFYYKNQIYWQSIVRNYIFWKIIEKSKNKFKISLELNKDNTTNNFNWNNIYQFFKDFDNINTSFYFKINLNFNKVIFLQLFILDVLKNIIKAVIYEYKTNPNLLCYLDNGNFTIKKNINWLIYNFLENDKIDINKQFIKISDYDISNYLLKNKKEQHLLYIIDFLKKYYKILLFFLKKKELKNKRKVVFYDLEKKYLIGYKFIKFLLNYIYPFDIDFLLMFLIKIPITDNLLLNQNLPALNNFYYIFEENNLYLLYEQHNYIDCYFSLEENLKLFFYNNLFLQESFIENKLKDLFSFKKSEDLFNKKKIISIINKFRKLDKIDILLDQYYKNYRLGSFISIVKFYSYLKWWFYKNDFIKIFPLIYFDKETKFFITISNCYTKKINKDFYKIYNELNKIFKNRNLNSWNFYQNQNMILNYINNKLNKLVLSYF